MNVFYIVANPEKEGAADTEKEIVDYLHSRGAKAICQDWKDFVGGRYTQQIGRASCRERVLRVV